MFYNLSIRPRSFFFNYCFSCSLLLPFFCLAFSIFSSPFTRTFSNRSMVVVFSLWPFMAKFKRIRSDTPRPFIFFFVCSCVRVLPCFALQTHLFALAFSVHSEQCVCFLKLSFCGSILIGFNVCDSPINCLIHGFERFHSVNSNSKHHSVKTICA